LKLGVWRRKSEVRSQKSEVESLDKESKIEKYKTTLGTLAHFRHSKLVTGVWSWEFEVRSWEFGVKRKKVKNIKQL